MTSRPESSHDSPGNCPALAIVGAGAIGTLHAQSAVAEGLPVAVVCDTQIEKAQTLAHELGEARAVTRFEEVLTIDGVQAVVIAVPNRLHAGMAERALQAGTHVLLEKPMGMTVDECDRILRSRDDAGRALQISFVCRFAPAVVRVRQMIAEGQLGDVYHIRTTLCRRRGIPGLGRWFTSREESGGGVLIDIGVHLIDLALYLAGEPSVPKAEAFTTADSRSGRPGKPASNSRHSFRPLRVSAVCESRFGSPISGYRFTDMWAGPPNPAGKFDVEDSAIGLIRCGPPELPPEQRAEDPHATVPADPPHGRADRTSRASDCTMNSSLTIELAVTWAANIPEGAVQDGVLVLGSKGGCFFDIWGKEVVICDESTGQLSDRVVAVTDVDDTWTAAWRAQHKAFADIVRGGAAQLATGEDGRTVQEVVEAMYRSSEEGTEVEVQ